MCLHRSKLPHCLLDPVPLSWPVTPAKQCTTSYPPATCVSHTAVKSQWQWDAAHSNLPCGLQREVEPWGLEWLPLESPGHGPSPSSLVTPASCLRHIFMQMKVLVKMSFWDKLWKRSLLLLPARQVQFMVCFKLEVQS